MNLLRVSGSFVIARNTAFTFKGKNVDAKEIGKQLGVRYVLKGSVRRDRGRVRVTLSQSRGAWCIISLCFLLSLKPPNTTKPSKIRDVLKYNPEPIPYPGKSLLFHPDNAPGCHREERVMATTFVRHTVSNYKTWRKVYDDFAAVQKAKGVTAQAVYQAVDTPTTSQ